MYPYVDRKNSSTLHNSGAKRVRYLSCLSNNEIIGISGTIMNIHAYTKYTVIFVVHPPNI